MSVSKAGRGVRPAPLENGRFAYERAIRRSTLPAPARHLALTIATWANLETGIIPERFQPSLSTLAEATGMSTATVKRHLNVLEAEGWIRRDRPEGDTAWTEHARTAYTLTIPAKAWLTLSQGADDPGLTVSQDRDYARLTVSQGLGSQAAKARLTVSHKSALSSEEVPLSLVASEDPPADEAGNGEREEAAPIKSEPRADPAPPVTAAQRAVRSTGLVPPEHEAAFIRWVEAKSNPRSPAGWWPSIVKDIPEHAANWRAAGGGRTPTERPSNPRTWEADPEPDPEAADTPADRARKFLLALPAPWTPGHSAVTKTAHQLATNAAAQGWGLDGELTAYLTGGQAPESGAEALLRHRISELPPYRGRGLEAA